MRSGLGDMYRDIERKGYMDWSIRVLNEICVRVLSAER